MDTATRTRSEPTHFWGAELPEGKLRASNSGVCVEGSYPTAYYLGCGKVRWPGWVNVDLSGSDLDADLRDLPIASDTADAVAAVHVLEHFYRWEVEALLLEWRRILKPGGKLILELPCMDKILGYVAYCVQHREPLQEFMTLTAFYGDPKHQDEAMCHKWGWFAGKLIEVLETVGFREIRMMDAKYHFPFRDARFEAIK